MMTTEDAYFFDSDCLLGLFIETAGFEEIRHLFSETGFVYSSWVILADTLAILKEHLEMGRIDAERYQECVHKFFSYLRLSEIRLVDIVSEGGECCTLGSYDYPLTNILRRHPFLDAAKALRLLALKTCMITLSSRHPKLRLVTSDTTLLQAALLEGIPTHPIQAGD